MPRIHEEKLWSGGVHCMNIDEVKIKEQKFIVGASKVVFYVIENADLCADIDKLV